MYVIGTAGHIDHGKSTLVEALTGYHPDRLKEEKERGMTIELGFTHLALPSGIDVGIVDVPGHHRFVKNMLAGVGGVDAALFVVAATESWMPQSQEHLEILDLLGVSRGVIVLSKIDLVEAEWVEMVEEEIREQVAGTVLADAPIARVSAVRKQGLDELVAMIDRMIQDAPRPLDLGRPRMWIDRVFTIKGTGTVVTGTLGGGAVRIDDELEVLPSGKVVRIRGLQAHGKPVDAVYVGGRVAINVAGVDFTDLHRGDALVAPGHMRASSRFSAYVRTVPSLERPLERESDLKLHIGTAERMAHVKLLDRESLGPGETALAQIEIDQACAVQWNDRYVLRDPAHQATVAGGRVLVPVARKVRGRNHRYVKHERSQAHRVLGDPKVDETLDLDLLRRRLDASPEVLIETEIVERGWLDRRELPATAPFRTEDLDEAVGRLVGDGRLKRLRTYLVSGDAWEKLQQRTKGLLQDYHRSYPLRTGLPRETLRTSLGVDWRLFDEVIEAMEELGTLVSEGARVRLREHAVRFGPDQQETVDRIMAALNAEPFTPPNLQELIGKDDDELIGVLVEQGRLVRIGKDLYFSAEGFGQIRSKVVDYLRENETIDIGNLRNLLGTTRKYAVPLLECLDQLEVTRRVGDVRVLGPKA